MPRDRPPPLEVEPSWLDRSLDRHLIAGLVFMAVLVAGFGVYRAREPDLRATAKSEERTEYVQLGRQLFASSCASCHGDDGVGGDSPTLNAREFLTSTNDEQIRMLVSAGVAGTEMPVWSIDLGGSLTDQQIQQLVAYIRSWEPDAPSVPNWREGLEDTAHDHDDEGG
ncbi:MAG TPA: cytochrome c [Jiangellaceae bacterium]